MPQVEIKGVGPAQFPDGMSAEEIREFLRRKYTQQAVAGTQPMDLNPLQATAQAYEPTMSERIGQSIAGGLKDTGIISDNYAAQRIGSNLGMIGEVLPGIGDATAGDEFGRALKGGDGIGMALGALGAIPIAGDFIGKGGKVLTSKMKEGKDFVLGDGGEFVVDEAKKLGGDFTQKGFDTLTGELPVINPNDLLGRTVVPTLADLTGSGRAFEGIDSSNIMPIELQGGPGFPLLDSYNKNNIVWAVNDQGGLTKLQKGDIIAVSAMSPTSHRSNATVNQAFMSTLDSYVTGGRVSSDQLDKINTLVKSNPDFADFPNLENQDAYHAWAEGLTFDKRAKFASILESKAAQKLGTPNFQKILDETIDPKYAGANQGDTMLLIEVDKTPDARVELGTEGTKKHRSYKYGVKGKVIGQFENPVSNETLFPDFFAKRRAEGADPAKDYRSFQLSLPSQEITPDVVSALSGKPLKSISSPRQAKLAEDFMQGNWRDSSIAKKEGGVSITDFTDELRNSDASAALTLYNPKDLAKEVRSGGAEVYQLGDSKVFFGIKNNYNYADEYGVDLVAAGLSPNERAVVGVVNNEKGAKGVAGTSVMLKAIEQGATVLDAFSVKSKKFPDGFLPTLYGEYGFSEVASVPFDPQYYTKFELDDLKKLWSKSGWDESQGYPDVSVMKWAGNDNARATITKDWINAAKSGDETSFIGRGTEQSLGTASEAFFKQSGPNGGQARGIGNARNDSGGIRDSNRASSSSRFAGVVKEVSELDPAQRRNLGMGIIKK